MPAIKKAADETWVRLASAAMASRTAWRALMHRIDQAIATGETLALPAIKDLAARHSILLTQALKNPSQARYSRSRKHT
jgi:hypothetical protein